jgi:uncharacterized protein YkwD
MRRLNTGTKETDLYQNNCSSRYSVASALTAEESISSHPSMADAMQAASPPGKKSLKSSSKSSNKKYSSSRRRGSLSGASVADDEPGLDQSDVLEPKKPKSHRRRSLFGSTPTEDIEEEPKKTTSTRRRSMLGSTSTSEDELGRTPDMSDDSLDQYDSVAPQKPASRRRGSLTGIFASAKLEEDQSDSVAPKKPASRRRGSLTGIFASAEPEEDQSDSVAPKKPASRRRGSLTGLFASAEPEEDQSDSVAPKKPASRRRGSLTGLFGSSDRANGELVRPPKDAESVTSRSITSRASSNSGHMPPPSPSTKPKSRRRMSLTRKSMDASSGENGHQEGKKENSKKKDKCKKKSSEDETKKPSSRRILSIGKDSARSSTPETPRSRRKSLSCSSTHSVSSVENNVNVHEIISELRVKSGLQTFSRNMLMDTIAKQVSRDLAASKGTKCTPTNYYGNVGQGESVEHILDTMTTRKGTAKENILNPHFKEFGLGMTRKDGLIYMCQVFK